MTESKPKIDATFHAELIHEDAFIAENAVVRGQVQMGQGASVWYGAVVRGDTAPVEIGERSNVQDMCVIHADPGFPCRIGNDVTIGHAAVVHGATIGDGALIGIGAIILNGAVVGAGAIVGAGAFVGEGKEIPPGKLAVGSPARAIRELTAENMERVKHAAGHYVEAAAEHRKNA